MRKNRFARVLFMRTEYYWIRIYKYTFYKELLIDSDLRLSNYRSML